LRRGAAEPIEGWSSRIISEPPSPAARTTQLQIDSASSQPKWRQGLKWSIFGKTKGCKCAAAVKSNEVEKRYYFALDE
jgi:hypothetical protein